MRRSVAQAQGVAARKEVEYVPPTGRNKLKAHFILYVADQRASTRFYQRVLARKPELEVPGMTEFHLNDGSILGLMPEAGIKRLLGKRLPDPAAGKGAPRAEVYLLVDEPEAFHRRALENGAAELSPLLPRDWGHEAAYSLDPDGHVLSFAKVSRSRHPALPSDS